MTETPGGHETEQGDHGVGPAHYPGTMRGEDLSDGR
jgi:hypothetical protein